jgi:hypothetical protein
MTIRNLPTNRSTFNTDLEHATDHNDSMVAINELSRLFLPLRSGLYMFTCGGGPSTSTPTNNSLRAYPWIVPNAITLTRVGIEIVTAGQSGAVVRLGIYADDGGYPAALLADFGTVAGDAVAVVEKTISQALTPGIWWVAAVTQNAATTAPVVRSADDMAMPGLAAATIPTAATNWMCFQDPATISGALPSTFGAGNENAANVPRVFVKT